MDVIGLIRRKDADPKFFVHFNECLSKATDNELRALESHYRMSLDEDKQNYTVRFDSTDVVKAKLIGIEMGKRRLPSKKNSDLDEILISPDNITPAPTIEKNMSTKEVLASIASLIEFRESLVSNEDLASKYEDLNLKIIKKIDSLLDSI